MATGVLRVKVDGVWRDLLPGLPSGGKFVMDPAYAGPRSDAPTDAFFGRVDASQLTLGMGMRGSSLIYVNIPSGGNFQINPQGGNSVFQAIQNYVLLYAGGAYWKFGAHPSHGLSGIWLTSDESAGSYQMLASNGQTYLNGSGGIQVRVGNANKMIVDASNVSIYPQLNTNNISCGYLMTNGNTIDAGRIVATSGQFRNAYTPPNGSWDTQNVACSGYGNFASVSLNSPGYAVCMRNSVWSGSPLEVLSLDMSVWVPVYAGAFSVQSSLDTKREVRDLHHQRERIVVKHDPMADEVPVLDVMSLRPVAFRPKTPNRKMVAAPGYDEMDPKDRDSWIIVDEDNPNLAIQGTRERLGLVADEVQHIIPSAVAYDRDGQPLGIDYAQITVALLDHVQQLTETVATLKYRITELENRA